MKIGIIVNPIAGLGGPLGLGGSDGLSWLAEQGVKGPSYKRAVSYLSFLREALISKEEGLVEIFAGEGLYGHQSLAEALIEPDVIVECRSSANLCSRELSDKMADEGVDLIIFFGGDGTAFDVALGSNNRVPIVGVPAGTKMYNPVFVLSEHHLLELLSLFIEGETEIVEKEVFLVDEELLQKGVYKIIDKTTCKTVHSEKKLLFQDSKDLASSIDEEELMGIAKFLEEEYGFPLKGTWIIGPGRTLQKIAGFYGFTKGFLGFMGISDGKVVCHPCSSSDLARILTEKEDARILLSPIGGSEFLVGRGNKELTPRVLRLIGDKSRILIVSTKDKLRRIKYMLVDTGDAFTDSLLEGYTRVIVGYYEEMVAKVLSSSKTDMN